MFTYIKISKILIFICFLHFISVCMFTVEQHECKDDGDCNKYQHTSCAEDRSDKKRKCLCADYLPPSTSGDCKKLQAGNGESICSLSPFVTWGTEIRNSLFTIIFMQSHLHRFLEEKKNSERTYQT